MVEVTLDQFKAKFQHFLEDWEISMLLVSTRNNTFISYEKHTWDYEVHIKRNPYESVVKLITYKMDMDEQNYDHVVEYEYSLKGRTVAYETYEYLVRNGEVVYL